MTVQMNHGTGGVVTLQASSTGTHTVIVPTPVYSATSSSLANGASLTVTHAADANFYRTPKFIGDLAAGDNTMLLLLGEGTNNSTTFVDSSYYNRTGTLSGAGPVISTEQAKFGSASIKFTGNDQSLNYATSADFAFGTGTFIVRTWVYPTTAAGNGPGTICDFRTGATASAFVMRLNSSRELVFYDGPNNAEKITSGTPVTLNAWNYVEATRSGTTLYLAVNGTIGFSGTVSSNFGSSQPIYIGRNLTAGYSLTGYLDAFQVFKGTAGNTSNYTPPTTAPTLPSPAKKIFLSGVDVRYDDGAGADSSTKTTFTNNTGSAIANAVAMVDLTQGAAA